MSSKSLQFMLCAKHSLLISFFFHHLLFNVVMRFGVKLMPTTIERRIFNRFTFTLLTIVVVSSFQLIMYTKCITRLAKFQKPFHSVALLFHSPFCFFVSSFLTLSISLSLLPCSSHNNIFSYEYTCEKKQ